MECKSKGINRLGIVSGFIFDLLWFIYRVDLASKAGRHQNPNEFTILVGTLVAFFIGWLLVRAFYWVYRGFKEDSEDEVPAEHSEETIGDEESTMPSDRIPCPNESCLGTLNEDGICNYCKKTPNEIKNAPITDETTKKESGKKLKKRVRKHNGYGFL